MAKKVSQHLAWNGVRQKAARPYTSPDYYPNNGPYSYDGNSRRDAQPCPQCGVMIGVGEEYPSAEDQPESEWDSCPECGSELPWTRAEHQQNLKRRPSSARSPMGVKKFDRIKQGFWRKNESGPSGYTTAFTRPDPLDPNDRKRQQTQARLADFPYDQPVSYGRAVGTDMGGAAYQSGARSAPPVPRKLKASDWTPKDPWNLAYEALTDPYEPGEQADDAFRLGYGSHGRMGEEDDVDMDDLRKSFRSCIPTDEVQGAFAALLAILSAFSGDEEGGDSADGSDLDILSGGGGDEDTHVFAPGAEDDPETL